MMIMGNVTEYKDQRWASSSPGPTDMSKPPPITVEEYMRNEVVKKDKMIGVDRLNELVLFHRRLYENETLEKPIKSNYGPIKSIREHTQTHMQALA